jgi:hypothetical protein
MRLGKLALAAVGALIIAPTLGAAPAFAATHAWGKAIQVPGIAALNSAGDAETTSVSCATSGNCSAGGFYTATGQVTQQAFVVTQTAGTWGQAVEVPGSAALNAGGLAEVNSVSCASAGNCAVGGVYTDSTGVMQAFVVSQVNGIWGQAIEVPGTAAVNVHGAQVNSVSCASAGNCAAGGFYADSSGSQQPFVANETAGTWDQAVEVPGVAAAGGALESLSCPAAGDCTAVGGAGNGTAPAFVARESGGTWSDAQAFPGLAALGGGTNATASSVSCSSPGNCTAGGSLTDSSGSALTFVASESKGTWGQAEQVPGIAALGTGGGSVNSVSCTSAGDCTAAGDYIYSSGQSAFFQGFAVTQSGGTWGTAETIPGLSSLNKGDAQAFSVSCASKGNCALAGYYQAGKTAASFRPFVANQVNGLVQTAHEVPGIGAMDVGGSSEALTVSCARGGTCVLGGWYSSARFILQGFVDSQG